MTPDSLSREGSPIPSSGEITLHAAPPPTDEQVIEVKTSTFAPQTTSNQSINQSIDQSINNLFIVQPLDRPPAAVLNLNNFSSSVGSGPAPAQAIQLTSPIVPTAVAVSTGAPLATATLTLQPPKVFVAQPNLFNATQSTNPPNNAGCPMLNWEPGLLVIYRGGWAD